MKIKPIHLKPAYEDTGLTLEEIIEGKLLTGWIPCTERLPEVKGKYLTVRTEYDNCKDKVIKIQISRFDPEDRYDVEFFKMEVDAWQPLPEPWKGEQE